MPSVTDLIDAEAMSQKLKGAVSADRLVELAQSKMLPHYLVDERLMFGPQETKEWVNHNLVARIPGATLGRHLLSVVNVVAPDATKINPPISLRALAGLLIPAGTESVENIPVPGVYFLCHGGEVVYVGQSVNVFSRVGQHFGLKTFSSVYFVRVPASDLDHVEGALIRALKPKYNHDKKGRLVCPYGRGECSDDGDRIISAMCVTEQEVADG